MRWSISQSLMIGNPNNNEPINGSLELLAPKDLHPFLRDGALLGDRTDSDSTFDTARHWLNTCQSRHHACSGQDESKSGWENVLFVPTRLIDIGVDGPIRPRLCERAQIPPNSKYMTLSHCWGGSLPTRLLSDNIHSMADSILLTALPKTFQDAMAAARRLGSRYLWIDALCIIQDSDEDWQNESQIMDLVYSGSYCNLAATAVADGSGGLFFQRDPRVYRPLEVRSDRSRYNVVGSDIWDKAIEQAPLNRRAWVCQERILAPRNLHFASTQLFWECSEFTACESFPTGFPSSTRKPHIGKPARRRLPADCSAASQLNARLAWNSIISVYSRAALTCETDKLVAIAGIAARMQPSLDDEYLAGLWRRHLTDNMMWRVKWPAKSVRPGKYVAPTWSWASVIGPISKDHCYPFYTEASVLVDVVNVEVEYKTSNRFGQVKGASLCLQGKLARLVIYLMDKHPLLCAERLSDSKILINKDINPTGREFKTGHENLYCLLMRNSRGIGENEIVWADGLLLERAEHPGEFRRFGTFKAGDEDVQPLMDACRYFDSKAEETGLEYCDDGKGGFKYTITII